MCKHINLSPKLHICAGMNSHPDTLHHSWYTKWSFQDVFFFVGGGWNKYTITEATTGLLYQLWMMMMSVEQSVECSAGETEVLRENLPQYLSVHHKSCIT
jgi:hypothetical protein